MKELMKRISVYGDIEYNRSFADCTTLRIGGNCEIMVYPFDVAGAIAILDILHESDLPIRVIGNGSNLLVSDANYHGVVICLNKYVNQYEFNDTTLTVGAGASIIAMSYATAKKGLSGFEFAAGIPGTIGGAIYMNAGAYKHDISEIVDSVLVYDQTGTRWLSKADCAFGYRQSIFQAHSDWVILQAKFNLNPGDATKIQELLDDRRVRRFNSQPLDYPSAGSVFRNPADMPAWKAIESVGLRGKRIGDAMVSEKHCNFIVNVGHAKASDFYELVQLIQREVKNKLDLDLIMEVERFNW